jgi:protein tyrosine/serine phosphatase
MMLNTRILSFDRVDNFRDFGHYGSRFGGRMSAGKLFRSGHYADATGTDLGRLAGLGISVITDLRRPTERRRDLVPIISGAAVHIIENDHGDQTESPHIEFLRQTDLSADSIGAYLTSYYVNAPFELRYRDLFARYFRALATLEGAALIHCTAGKDRTGILVALTHDLLGVHDEDIAADFLLTNQLMQVEARLTSFRPVLQGLTGRTPTDAAVRAFLGVDWEHLHAMLVDLRQKHGSVEGYVRRVLGIDSDTLERIRSRCLVGG